MANLMLSSTDRSVINGAMFKLDKRIKKPDTAMNDEALESRLWEFLVLSVAPKTEWNRCKRIIIEYAALEIKIK